VGRVAPHTEVKVVDPATGATLPRGSPGELCTRGYCVMKGGYWGEPEKTAEAIDKHGWMHTGDLATVDDEGYVRIVGRIKDMCVAASYWERSEAHLLAIYPPLLFSWARLARLCPTLWTSPPPLSPHSYSPRPHMLLLVQDYPRGRERVPARGGGLPV
jgi:hypothetical protein